MRMDGSVLHETDIRRDIGSNLETVMKVLVVPVAFSRGKSANDRCHVLGEKPGQHLVAEQFQGFVDEGLRGAGQADLEDDLVEAKPLVLRDLLNNSLGAAHDGTPGRE